MSRVRADEIVYSRRLILEALCVGRAIAMRGDKLFRIVRAQLETPYDEGLLEKDLLNLRERGWVRINAELSGKRADKLARGELGQRWHLDVWWEATAEGSDQAHGIKSDPALEC